MISDNFNIDFGKKGMLELKFIGRGGLGAKSAGEILAEVASELGFYIQAFPEYGAERMGAPVKSFIRISDKPIYIHSYVTNPDVIVLLDKTLFRSLNVTEGSDKKTKLIVNSESCDFKEKLTDFKGEIYYVNASGISLNTVGKNYPNIPMLGSVASLFEIFPLRLINKFVEKKFEKKLDKEIIEKNKETVKLAYQNTKRC